MKSRKSIPENLKEPLKVSKFVQLYLIKRENIFKFHFLDMLNNQFTVEIGPQINCSCIPGYYDHCIHSFYVLQKIFKLKEDNPLIWKNNYSQKDLQTLIEYEKDPLVKNKEILRNLKSMNNEFDLELNMSLLKLDPKDDSPVKENPKKQIPTLTYFEEKNINESKVSPKPSEQKFYNDLLNQLKLELQTEEKQLFGSEELRFCPICHQNIMIETPAFQCKEKCKNFFHIKCLKFWVKHQRKIIVENDRVDQECFEHRSNIRVSCPMCRNKFPEDIQKRLTEGEIRFKKHYQSQNQKCSECNQEIYLKLYHCLLCKNINICDVCYKGWKHQKHDRFLMKAHKKSEWEVPPGRSAFNMSKLQFSLEYIKKLSKNSKQTKTQGQIKQLFGQNYQKFLQSNLPKPEIFQYLKQSFLNVEKEIHKTYKQVDFNENSLKCLACKKPSIIGMKRMFCAGKHFFDQKCLTFFLKNNFFECPMDKTYFLQGLQGIGLNMKGSEKKIIKKEKPKTFHKPKKFMKIPQSTTNVPIQSANTLLTPQKVNQEVYSNQIRDKLRKKKQIAKSGAQSGSKGLVNQKQRQKELFCGKKYKNSVLSGNSSKPNRKTQSNETQRKEEATDLEMVSQFFDNELVKYYPLPSQILIKPGNKSTKKISESSCQKLIEGYLNELNGQNEVKVTGLLQEKEKPMFKTTKITEFPQYEQSAKNFMEQIKKKQQKQNCLFYNGNFKIKKLQKTLELILQKTNSHYNATYFYSTNLENLQIQHLSELSNLQKEYLIQARAFEKVWENDLAAKINETPEMKNIAKMLLILTKCYKSNNKKVKEILKNCQENQQKLTKNLNSSPCLSQTSSNIEFYTKCMIKKCLVKTFSETETMFSSDYQLWNHFKLTSYLEQNIIQEGYRDHEKYLPIETDEEYKEYMKRIKNKKIIYKPSLHTNCKACFSNHFQRANPIVKCPECKSRLHKYCGKIDDRCDKCSYKKLGATLKAETPKCFICQNDSTSLMLHKLKGTRFVHNFCMLVHNLWTISNDKLTYVANRREQTENQESTKSFEAVYSTEESIASFQAIHRKSMKNTSIVILKEKEENADNKDMIDESEDNNIPKIPSFKERKCKICTKFSLKEYMKQCKHCQESFHVICAYLSGYAIEISEWKNTFDIDLNIKCCAGTQQEMIEFQQMRQKRERCRKYRLNYERFALNYGFENEVKTSKMIESCCNIAEVDEDKYEHTEKEMSGKFEGEQALEEMKDESQQES